LNAKVATRVDRLRGRLGTRFATRAPDSFVGTAAVPLAGHLVPQFLKVQFSDDENRRCAHRPNCYPIFVAPVGLSPNRQLSISNFRIAGDPPATQESAFQWIENLSMSALAICHSSRITSGQTRVRRLSAFADAIRSQSIGLLLLAAASRQLDLQRIDFRERISASGGLSHPLVPDSDPATTGPPSPA
jgi:hypothetical protein